MTFRQFLYDWNGLNVAWFGTINQDRRNLMGPEHFWWGGSLPFPIIMAIAVVMFVTMLYFAFGRGGSRPPWWNDSDRPSSHPKDSETTIEVLEKRYAKSEISREVFEQMKKDILG